MRRDDGTLVCSGELWPGSEWCVSRRVVVTGLGVIAANGNGLAEFELALRKGRSGPRRPALDAEAGFACHVAACRRAWTRSRRPPSARRSCWP